MLMYFLADKSKSFVFANNAQNEEFGFFSKIGEFLSALLKKRPNLIFIDFYFFNKDYFSLEQFLNERRIFIPLLYFNSPCIAQQNLAEFWYYQILPYICEGEHEIYKVALESLLQKIHLNKKEEKNETFFSYGAQGFKGLSKKNMNLLRFIFDSPKPLCTSEIQDHFLKIGQPFSDGALQVAFSRLRHAFLNNSGCKMELLKEREGYRIVKVRELF